MSFVLVFGVAMVGFVELNTYDTAESCKAARQAATQAIAELEWFTTANSEYAEYFCIAKPD